MSLWMCPKKTSTNSFTPASVSGLQLWLDANVYSSITFSGSDITQWDDQSGYGRNATPNNTSGGYPQYTSTGVNSKPSIVFADNISMKSTVPTGTTPSAVTIFLVFERTGSGLGGYTMICDRTEVPNPSPFEMFNDARYRGNNTSQSDSFNASFNFETSSDATNIYIMNCKSDTWQEWANATVSINDTTTSGLFGDDNCSSVYIASRSDNSMGFTGNLAEIVLYNRILTNTERQNVEQYLKTKWGFTYSGLSSL
jgi:hypothetical protein